MAEKEKQHQLVAVIKGVHSKLRQQYKSDKETFDKAWNDHCQNDAVLSEYASAMVQLATDVWATTKKETRIDWCCDICREFFYKGGLEKAIEKDQRRQRFKENFTEICTLSSDKVHERDCANNITSKARPMLSKEVRLPMEEKIRLLDVGSCYNPFEGYPDFLPLAVDLSPAIQSVRRCDFSKLQITESQTDPIDLPTVVSHPVTDPIDLPTVVSQPVTTLPPCSFHVVVFSLLLEYLPSVQQRWLCCQKAHQLLLNNGLLVIITPDSNHQNKNAPMMKKWKSAIESLGFSRWKYVKQEHLHCMAFRKTRETSEETLDGAEDMLHIPQDFTDPPEDNVLHSTGSDMSHGCNADGMQELGELPFCEDFDL